MLGAVLAQGQCSMSTTSGACATANDCCHWCALPHEGRGYCTASSTPCPTVDSAAALPSNATTAISFRTATAAPALTCTGNSTKLPQAQCEAWIALYSSTNGDKWTGPAAACTKTDPCSCVTSDFADTYHFCNPTGTTVTNM